LPLLELPGHAGGQWPPVRALFSPDGTLVATTDGSPMVRIWDAATGTLRHELEGHLRHGRALAFSPNGPRLVSGGYGGAIKVWDVATGRLTLTLRDHEERVNTIAFSPDGAWFVAGGNDTTLTIYDAGPAARQTP
jgi:WD40 repeat protein